MSSDYVERLQVITDKEKKAGVIYQALKKLNKKKKELLKPYEEQDEIKSLSNHIKALRKLQKETDNETTIKKRTKKD